LATLGFDGRRAAWARGELLAALKILQSGDIDRAHMVGSWAGAMGQTQFLPSVFLAHAVDADGDGKRDIWGSMADVVVSTAASWPTRAGAPASPGAWKCSCQRASTWAAQTARCARRPRSGRPKACRRWAAPAAGDGRRRDPAAAGARGPAFLVGRELRAILRYNNSTSYALAVGLLAHAWPTAPPVQAPWPRDLQALSRNQVLALQTALNDKGFDSGTPDGLIGPGDPQGAARLAAQRGAAGGWVSDGGVGAAGAGPKVEGQ
jgi:membrane-bound lytic murein transglycosylase B